MEGAESAGAQSAGNRRRELAGSGQSRRVRDQRLAQSGPPRPALRRRRDAGRSETPVGKGDASAALAASASRDPEGPENTPLSNNAHWPRPTHRTSGRSTDQHPGPKSSSMRGLKSVQETKK